MASTTTTGGGGRKRKREQEREKLKQYGVDLPDIPGLPVQLIPIHVHALQTTVKYFRSSPGTTVPPVSVANEYSSSSSSISGAALASKQPAKQTQTTTAVHVVSTSDPEGQRQQANVMESIFSRLDQSHAKATESEAQRQCRERKKAKDEAIENWLQAVHRHLRDNDANRQNRAKTTTTTIESSVAVSSMKHLWGLLHEHKRVNVRRACLHMSAHLLLKSSDCRRWLLAHEPSTLLMDWIDSVHAMATTVNNSQNGEEEATARSGRHLQRESYLLLKQLESQGYGELYPTLTVALMRFRQLVHLQTEEDDSCLAHQDLAVLRRLRDAAMENYLKEETLVNKLIKKAYACMDTIVPRITAGGDDEIPPKAAAHAPVEDTNEDDEEDENVDWEDGWEEDEGKATHDSAHSLDNDAAHHLAAVDRTLATMAATGGLRAGEIEIQLGPEDPDTVETPVVDPEKVRAMQKLSRHVERLSTRHLPRLTAWTNGLTKADTLMESKSGSSVSLVSMPRSRYEHRKEVLDRIIRLKSTVASVLSSAKRLGLESEQRGQPGFTGEKAGAPTLRSQQRIPALDVTRPSSVATALQRRRVVGSTDKTRQRSNRIQVKYRKN